MLWIELHGRDEFMEARACEAIGFGSLLVTLIKATHLLSKLLVCNFSKLIENERLQGSLFTMNVHSCHLKVRGKGGKGSTIPTTVPLHPWLFMQWVIFIFLYT